MQACSFRLLSRSAPSSFPLCTRVCATRSIRNLKCLLHPSIRRVIRQTSVADIPMRTEGSVFSNLNRRGV
ncbi:hypothetical protein L1049_013913 [Liquidambar formosana]|uniref:Uncharacterized protein n=1 Tax=Liquidambar formosana TaxID=63359 RepID=A0AAP0WX84_LIQFO